MAIKDNPSQKPSKAEIKAQATRELKEKGLDNIFETVSNVAYPNDIKLEILRNLNPEEIGQGLKKLREQFYKESENTESDRVTQKEYQMAYRIVDKALKAFEANEKGDHKAAKKYMNELGKIAKENPAAQVELIEANLDKIIKNVRDGVLYHAQINEKVESNLSKDAIYKKIIDSFGTNISSRKLNNETIEFQKEALKEIKELAGYSAKGPILGRDAKDIRKEYIKVEKLFDAASKAYEATLNENHKEAAKYMIKAEKIVKDINNVDPIYKKTLRAVGKTMKVREIKNTIEEAKNSKLGQSAGKLIDKVKKLRGYSKY